MVISKEKTSPKKKFLFLMITTGIGGAERLQMDYFRHTDYGKHSAVLAVSNDVFSPYFQKEGLPVKVVQLPEIKYGERFFKKFTAFYKFLKGIRPDYVVINQFWLKSLKILTSWYAGSQVTRRLWTP